MLNKDIDINVLPNQDKNHSAIVADLRAFIKTKENKTGTKMPARSTWKLDLADVDEFLPINNLCRNGVHEIVPSEFGDEAAAIGFTLSLLKQYVDLEGRPRSGSILWCQNAETLSENGRMHAHGITRFGLDPDRFIFAEAKNTHETLWVLEEAARCADLCAIVGEVGSVSFTETRRLTLAAQEAGIPLLLIRNPKYLMGTNANTRWRVSSDIGQSDFFDAKAPGNPTWQVELMRCRGGRPHAWRLEWCYEAHCFSLASLSSSQPFVAGSPAQEAGQLVAFG